MGVINTIWAILIAILGVWLVPKAGATGAVLAFLISHLFSQLMVIVALARLHELPKGYLPLFSVTTLGGLSLAALGYWRIFEPNRGSTTLALAALAIFILGLISYVGHRTGCLPEWPLRKLNLHTSEPSEMPRLEGPELGSQNL
jgi:hypothetical protein